MDENLNFKVSRSNTYFQEIRDRNLNTSSYLEPFAKLRKVKFQAVQNFAFNARCFSHDFFDGIRFLSVYKHLAGDQNTFCQPLPFDF